MTQLLTWSFWFSATPPALVPMAGRVWSGIAIVAILAGILFRAFVVRRASQAFVARAWARVTKFLTANGALLFVLLFFRYEGVPFFAARFWLLLLGIGDLLWVIAILRHLLVRLPKEKAALATEQQKQKYLKR
ncbi:MAG: hypothetical protein Q7S02_05695 [bacterium]|nr:hypothetical protein [bacterium]